MTEETDVFVAREWAIPIDYADNYISLMRINTMNDPFPDTTKIGWNELTKYEIALINFYLARIADNVENGGTGFILVHGKQGSGKSALALLFAMELKRMYGFDFDIETSYITDVGKFLKDVKEHTRKVYIFDEAVSMFYSRRAMSKMNVMINLLMNMVRYRQSVMFFVLPFWNDLDAGLRKHMDFVFYTYRRSKIRRFQPQRFMFEERSGRTFYYPVKDQIYLASAAGDVKVIEAIPGRYPNPEIVYPDEWAKYMKIKDAYFKEYVTKLEESLVEMWEEMTTGKKKRKTKTDLIAEELARHWDEYSDMSNRELAEVFGVSNSTIHEAKKRAIQLLKEKM